MQQHRLALMMLAFALVGTFAFIILPSLPGRWEPRRAFAEGDGYTQYFPIVHRARPGIRDLVGLNTVQFPTSEGSDIVTIRLGGFLTAVTFGNNQHDDSPSWSSTQQLILARTYPLDGEPERGNLVVIEGEYYLGTTTTPITQNDNLKREFQWSPTDDISYLETTQAGRTDLWIAPAGTFTPTVVLTDVVNYRWSPTGDAIAFTANRDGDSDLFLSTPDGTTITPLTSNNVEDVLGEWVAQGTEVLIRRTDSTTDDLWIIAADGSNERQFTNQPGGEALVAVAPLGNRIAYLQYRPTGLFDLFVQNVDSPPPDPAAALWFCPADPECYIGDGVWSPSGEGLVWRVFTENLVTGAYEWRLLWSVDGSEANYSLNQGGIPEGKAVWADGTDWLIYALIEPGTTTTNLFTQELTFPSGDQLQLTTGDADFIPVEWQQIYTPLRGTP